MNGHTPQTTPVAEGGLAGSLGSRIDLRRTLGPVAALLILIVGFAILSDNFLTLNNFVNITRQASVLLVIALAGTFIVLIGSIDLSVGSVATLGAIVGAVLFRDVGSLPVFLVLVVALGAAAGLINGALVAYGKLPSFLVTLGTLFAFDGLALYISGGQPIPVRETGGLESLYAGTLLGIPNSAIFALLIFAGCVWLARSTRFGRYLYAIGGSERAARLSGVPVERYKLIAFTLSGILAAVAGAMLMLRVGSGAPGTGEPFLLTSLAAIVMGGTPLTGGLGGPARTLLGVVIIAVLANGMSVANVDPFLQVFVQGVVVILAVALTLDRTKLLLIK